MMLIKTWADEISTEHSNAEQEQLNADRLISQMKSGIGKFKP